MSETILTIVFISVAAILSIPTIVYLSIGLGTVAFLRAKHYFNKERTDDGD